MTKTKHEDMFAFPSVGAMWPNGTMLHNGRNETLDILAASLTMAVERPVVNRTGIEGRFDIALKYSADGTPMAQYITDTTEPSNAPSLRDALKDYGLELKPSKGIVEFVVIDSVEEPTPN
jgi:uncharacterized protein (TIGR03435 family)